MLLGCIADDFTGATDLANTLTRPGMGTILMIGVSKAVALITFCMPLANARPRRGKAESCSLLSAHQGIGMVVQGAALRHGSKNGNASRSSPSFGATEKVKSLILLLF